MSGMFRNFRNVGKIVYGPGAVSQLGSIADPVREKGSGSLVFLVDDWFEGRDLPDRLPATGDDEIHFIDASHEEPKTGQVDLLRDEILDRGGLPSGVVGIGGGSVMDIAKALALMLTNEGSSTLYQGLNLVKRPGVWHCGIPTISGTGAEVSMTAVLTGPEKKLGLKCEWTPFDQLVLDPELPATVPDDHWFYTGMDCYIHCIEAETGRHYNAFSKAYGDEALKLCREVFLGEGAGRSSTNDEKLMVASLFGGLSLTYSEVGACHAISYGLSYVLGMRHGIANCVAFRQLRDFYPRGVDEFETMVEKHSVPLPEGMSEDWSDEQIRRMAEIAYGLPHMWDHAVGPEWRQEITLDRLESIFRRL
jgi:3-deoxy-alpha-D-manno-octulosonate 8-oxidase